MAKKIRDSKNGRIYDVIEEDEDTYTFEKGELVGVVAVRKLNSDGTQRFKIIKK